MKYSRSSLVAQTVKNSPAIQETWVRFLSGEDPLEKGMATQYSCLEDPMDRGAWWATVHEVAKSWTRVSTNTFTLQESPFNKQCWNNWISIC